MLLFLLIPLPVLYGLHYVVGKGLRKSSYVHLASWNDLFSSRINEDIIICGSSRAMDDISPRILDTVLHAGSYNLGMDGTHISLQCDRFTLYLQHNRKPKVVIYAVDLTSFAERGTMDNAVQFLPYLNDTGVISVTGKYSDRFTLAERYVPMFRYNNQLALIGEGIRSYFGQGVKPVKYKGYYPHNNVWDNSFDNYIKRVPHPVNIRVVGYSVKRLETFIGYCRQNDIKVILVFPPVYYRFLDYCSNKDYIMNIFRSCETRYGVKFLDYSHDSIGMSKANFYNSQHLNMQGAEQFSLKLANDLKAAHAL